MCQLILCQLTFSPMHFRLSYHQRVKDIVPESFLALVPELPAVTFKYQKPESTNEEAMEQDSK